MQNHNILETNPCNQLSNQTKENGFLIFSELTISKENLKSILRNSVTKALSIKEQKIAEKNSSYLTTYIQQHQLPIFQYSATIDFDDMMGLIGEIVSEIHHQTCNGEEILYVKWQDTGTSKSPGLDLIFYKNSQLYSIECKHPHQSLRNQSNDVSQIISTTVKKGFKSHDDHRTIEFITKLYQRYLNHKRFLEGNHLNTSEIEKKINLIRELIDSNNLVEEINVVVDKTYNTNNLDSELDSKIDFERYVLVSKSIGIVLLIIENIEELSQEVFSEYGN